MTSIPPHVVALAKAAQAEEDVLGILLDAMEEMGLDHECKADEDRRFSINRDNRSLRDLHRPCMLKGFSSQCSVTDWVLNEADRRDYRTKFPTPFLIKEKI